MTLDVSYSQTTDSVRVTVYPIYLESQSEPDENYFVWAYHIRIENLGKKPVRLRRRHWLITDAYGRQQEVNGQGVVGEEPTIEPDASYEYTSGTPLTTPSGIMMGTYIMERDSGEIFHVNVPAFSLDSPHQPMSIH